MQMRRPPEVMLSAVVASAVLACAAAATLLAVAEITPNAKLHAQIDGRQYVEHISLNFEKFHDYFSREKQTKSRGTVEIAVRKDTALARKLSQVARSKTRIPAVTIEATERNSQGTYHKVALNDVLVSSFSLRIRSEESDAARFRLNFEQISGKQR